MAEGIETPTSFNAHHSESLYSLRSTLVMLIPLPVLRHGRHQLFAVNSFRMPLSVGVSGSPPRSSSELRQEDESSKLEQRRLRGKQPQLRNILLSHRDTGILSVTGRQLSDSTQHLVHPLLEKRHNTHSLPLLGGIIIILPPSFNLQ